MFCQNCGAQIPDGADFCSSCGSKLVNAATKQTNTSSQSSSSGQGMTGKTSVSSAPNDIGGGQNKKSKKGPIIIIVLVIAIVAAIICWFAFAGSNSTGQMSTVSEQPENSESAGSEQSSDDGASSVSMGEPSKDNIQLSSVQLMTDTGGRYVITGSITNLSDAECAPTCTFKAAKHEMDEYDEEEITTVQSFGLQSATPNVIAGGNEMTVLGLQSGETRKFVLYPGSWSDSDVTYSDVEATVSEITLSASVLNHIGKLPDMNGDMEVSDLEYHQNGKVSGTLANNSKTYLDSAEITVIMLDGQGQPAVGQSNSTRPSGIVLKTASVNKLKPGASADFEINVGNGYSSVELLDITYRPDESKS